MIFKRTDDRRGEPRRPVNLRGVVSAPGYEVACVITDLSDKGLRVRLDRAAAPPERAMVVDVVDAAVYEVQVRWREGMEAGFTIISKASLRGLTPARLTLAREAWLRAGGR